MSNKIDQLRFDAEQDLTELLRRLNRRGRRAVAAAVQEFGSVEAIPLDFWEALKREVDDEAASVMLALLLGVYQNENRSIARRVSTEQRASVNALIGDDGSLRQQAAGSAASMGRQIADEYVDGVRTRLSKTLDPSETASKQRVAIDDVLDDSQIERTVSTNTTRGVTVAQDSAGNDIQQLGGIQLVTYWVTERDGKVCPICRPLDGQPQSRWEEITAAGGHSQDVLSFIGQGPPAHPNCRCSTRRDISSSVS